jgi:hypothetical protein
MDSRITDDVSEWAATSAGSGYAGLADLADAGFTGAVDGGAWALFVNGRVVGVFDGDIEAFEGAELTAHEAPEPALPLLYAMRERGGETRARYYTNDTPLSEANETLEEGGFTGYVELSENVLSGDYYVVYHGGKSMSVAFVGNSRRLVGGDEAFELAADEVGIYEVRDCDVDIVEIPEPSSEPTAAATGAPVDDGDTDAGTDGHAESGVDGDADGSSVDAADADGTTVGAADADGTTVDAADTDGTTVDAADTDGTTVDAADDANADGVAAETEETDTDDRAAETREEGAAAEVDPDGPSEDADPSVDVTASALSGSDDGSPEGSADDGEPTEADGADEADAADEADGADEADEADGAPAPDGRTERRDRPDGTGGAAEPRGERDDGSTEATSGAADADGSAVTVESDPAASGADQFTAEERWRNARSIPAIDPAESGDGDDTEVGTAAEPSASGRARDGRAGGDVAAADATAVAELQNELAAARDRQEELAEERDELTAERDRLRTERDELAEERDELAAQREELETEVDRLNGRVGELEAEIDRLESALREADGRADAERSLDPAEALSGTNLFVRYETKGDATLAAAREGDSDREAVNANLRLEVHTRFDRDGVVVDGEQFERFLEGTTEIRFVRWMVEDLLYELLGTGHAGDMDRLVDAIPRLDRAEFRGSVTVEDGEGEREESFDVVFRDRRGDPLVVADINDSRTEAGAGATESLVESASRLRESEESLAAALLVTSSFFDRGALAAAEEATSGGFLNRSKRASFVRVARKEGYHLCLIEARSGDFHVNVPEL